MAKISKDHPALLSKKECYSLISTYSSSAMRLRNLAINSYTTEIDSLARICTYLINFYSVKPQTIIERMEKTISDAFIKELELIDNEINTLFNRRKNAPHNTINGEQDIINLTVQINNLKQRKLVSVSELIQGIICDTLTHAGTVHGAEMPLDFNLDEYECRIHLTCTISTEKNPENKTIVEKN